MADEKDIKNEKEVNNLKKENNKETDKSLRLQSLLNDLSSTYTDTIRETLGIQTKRSTFDSNLLKVNKQINTTLLRSRTEFQSISQLSKTISDNQEVVNRGKIVAQSLEEGLVARGSEFLKISNKTVKNALATQKLREKRNDLLEIGQDLSKKELNELEGRERQLESSLEIIRKSGDASAQQLVFTKLNTSQLEKQNKALKDTKDASAGANFLSDLTSKIPGLGDASKEAFSTVTKSIQEGGVASKGLKGALGGTVKFAGALGKNLLKGLGPIGAIIYVVKKVIEAFGKADAEVVNLGKNLALSRSEAVAFRGQMQRAANISGDMFVTSSKLVKTFGELNKQFGFITKFSQGTLVDVTKLTEKVGISSESAGNLALASERTGKSLKENTKDTLAATYAIQRQTGVQFSNLEILEEVGKVTGQVRANLGANPAAIAEAITKAKLFGGELNDIVDSAKSFLDFESSISKELEAELLLGRDLNFERARAAAIQGDYATVAEEVAKQAGNFSNFTKLNVIQQEALANSLGISTDKLADNLAIQEAQGRSAEELKAIGRDDLAQRLEQTTAQQKLNALSDKFLSLATDIAVAFTPLVEILDVAFNIIKPIFNVIEVIMKALRPLTGFIVDLTTGTSKAVETLLTADGIASQYADNTLNTQIGTNIDKHSKQVIKRTKGQYKELEKISNNLTDKVMSSTEGVKQNLSDVGNDLFYGIQGDFENAYHDVVPKLKTVVEGIPEGMSQLKDVGEYKIQEYGYTVHDGINESFIEGQKLMNKTLEKISNIKSDIHLDSQKMGTITSTNTFNVQ